MFVNTLIAHAINNKKNKWVAHCALWISRELKTFTRSTWWLTTGKVLDKETVSNKMKISGCCIINARLWYKDGGGVGGGTRHHVMSKCRPRDGLCFSGTNLRGTQKKNLQSFGAAAVSASLLLPRLFLCVQQSLCHPAFLRHSAQN